MFGLVLALLRLHTLQTSIFLTQHDEKWTAVCVDCCQFYYTNKKLAASVPEATHNSFGPEPYI